MVLWDMAAAENLNMTHVMRVKEIDRREDTRLMQQLSLVQHLHLFASIIM